MILRGYQQSAVDKAAKALKARGNTLVQAATGAGKTIILAALAHKIGKRTLILQHRQELVQQNMSKYKMVDSDAIVSVVDANARSWRGNVVFAMQQTLTRNLGEMPKFDLVVVDEAHRLMAPSFRSIIDHAAPPMLAGFTATPIRGDKQTLREYFDNVSSRITIRELVGLGFLVPPRAFVVDVGVQAQLGRLKPQTAFGDQSDVAAVLNTVPINEQVVSHWKERAGDRQTIVFCSTVSHAEDVVAAYRNAGVSAEMVSGGMGNADRKAALARFDKGECQVMVNVAVLTEGYDSQPVSCVVLLRQCSEKGPLIQMAGRGLRTVDPELHPGIVKSDCVILDFGTSILTHGDLDQDDALREVKAAGDDESEPDTKICPKDKRDRFDNYGCGAELPLNARTCSLCGFVFGEGKDLVEQVTLTEFDIMRLSPFRWIDLFGSDLVLMASGFSAWAACVSPDGGNRWYALGKLQSDRKIHTLAVSSRPVAMAAADDFLRRYESSESSKKSRRWMDESATQKQLSFLSRLGYSASQDLLGRSAYTKYSAACTSNFAAARHAIEQKIGVTP